MTTRPRVGPGGFHADEDGTDSRRRHVGSWPRCRPVSSCLVAPPRASTTEAATDSDTRRAGGGRAPSRSRRLPRRRRRDRLGETTRRLLVEVSATTADRPRRQFVSSRFAGECVRVRRRDPAAHSATTAAPAERPGTCSSSCTSRDATAPGPAGVWPTCRRRCRVLATSGRDRVESVPARRPAARPGRLRVLRPSTRPSGPSQAARRPRP